MSLIFLTIFIVDIITDVPIFPPFTHLHQARPFPLALTTLLSVPVGYASVIFG